MNDENDIELLERFVNNTLSAEERASVAKRLEQDSSFKQLLADLKLLQEGIRANSREELKTLFQEIEMSLPGSMPDAKVVSWKPWLIGIAASIVLIAAAIAIWPQQKSNEELFAKYFEPYPNVIMPTVRGDLEADTTLMAKAYRAYDRGDYEKAIRFFEQVGVKDEGVYMYMGNSYLAIDSTEKAITCFEKVISDFDAFDDQAEWYLGLALLKKDQINESKKILTKIGSGKSSYGKKAKVILQNF